MTAPRMLLAALLLLSFGCGRSSSGGADAKPSAFHHQPPHGGTGVALGDGDYNLEVVRDAATGTLSAYVFDDDMEDFVRSPSPAVTIVARVGGESRRLTLAAVANPATGETVGDTALFQGQADWVRTTRHFSATVQAIEVHGNHFSDVTFDFPAGSDSN